MFNKVLETIIQRDYTIYIYIYAYVWLILFIGKNNKSVQLDYYLGQLKVLGDLDLDCKDKEKDKLLFS